MVIHGVNDDVVPGILVHVWKASDVLHSSLNTENNINTYIKLVENFTKCVENVDCKSISRN